MAFYGYDPARYVPDLSFIGEAAKGIGNAVRELPSALKRDAAYELAQKEVAASKDKALETYDGVKRQLRLKMQKELPGMSLTQINSMIARHFWKDVGANTSTADILKKLENGAASINPEITKLRTKYVSDITGQLAQTGLEAPTLGPKQDVTVPGMTGSFTEQDTGARKSLKSITDFQQAGVKAGLTPEETRASTGIKTFARDRLADLSPEGGVSKETAVQQIVGAEPELASKEFKADVDRKLQGFQSQDSLDKKEIARIAAKQKTVKVRDSIEFLNAVSNATRFLQNLETEKKDMFDPAAIANIDDKIEAIEIGLDKVLRDMSALDPSGKTRQETELKIKNNKKRMQAVETAESLEALAANAPKPWTLFGIDATKNRAKASDSYLDVAFKLMTATLGRSPVLEEMNAFLEGQANLEPIKAVDMPKAKEVIPATDITQNAPAVSAQPAPSDPLNLGIF